MRSSRVRSEWVDVLSPSWSLQACLFKNKTWLDYSNGIWGVAVLGQRLSHQCDLASDGKGVNYSHLKQLHATGAVAMLEASNALLEKKKMLVGFGLQPSCCLAQTFGESVLQDQRQVNCKEGFCRKKVAVKEGLAALLMVLRREKEASGKNPKPVVVAGVSGGAVTQPVLSDCCRESGPSPAGDLTASGDTGPSAAHPVCFRNVQLNQIKKMHITDSFCSISSLTPPL